MEFNIKSVNGSIDVNFTVLEGHRTVTLTHKNIVFGEYVPPAAPVQSKSAFWCGVLCAFLLVIPIVVIALH